VERPGEPVVPAARHDLLAYLTDRPTRDPSALQALSILPDREFTSPSPDRLP